MTDKTEELVARLTERARMLDADEFTIFADEISDDYLEAAQLISELRAENAILTSLKVNEDCSEDEMLLRRLETMFDHRGDGIPTQFVNPDGPDAAKRIRGLLLQVGRINGGDAKG